MEYGIHALNEAAAHFEKFTDNVRRAMSWDFKAVHSMIVLHLFASTVAVHAIIVLRPVLKLLKQVIKLL